MLVAQTHLTRLVTEQTARCAKQPLSLAVAGESEGSQKEKTKESQGIPWKSERQYSRRQQKSEESQGRELVNDRGSRTRDWPMTASVSHAYLAGTEPVTGPRKKGHSAELFLGPFLLIPEPFCLLIFSKTDKSKPISFNQDQKP